MLQGMRAHTIGLPPLACFSFSSTRDLIAGFRTFQRRISESVAADMGELFHIRNTLSFMRNKNMPNAAAWIAGVTSTLPQQTLHCKMT